MSKKKSVESRIIETKPINWRNLKFLQDDTFKEISAEERTKLRNSILERGFVDPFFVWLDSKLGIMYCLDGKHRADELEVMVKDGIQVPDELPATFVRCKDKKEAAEIKAWNEGKIEMLLAHAASAGHGLNLQYGGHLIEWFGVPWSLELYLQAVARLDRQGQKFPVINSRLIVKGTIDEDVIKALAGRMTVQDAVMYAVKARISKYRAKAA